MEVDLSALEDGKSQRMLGYTRMQPSVDLFSPLPTRKECGPADGTAFFGRNSRKRGLYIMCTFEKLLVGRI